VILSFHGAFGGVLIRLILSHDSSYYLSAKRGDGGMKGSLRSHFTTAPPYGE